MGLTTSDIPKGLTKGVKALFLQSLENLPAEWQTIAMVVDSAAPSETYSWLGAVPAVREFIGERQLKSLSEHYFTITNKTWESSIEIERAAIEDEQYGQIRPRIASLAEAVNSHRDEMVFDLLNNGFSDTCYDGAAFFSDSHAWGDNKHAKDLSASEIQECIAQMRKFTDDAGRPLNVNPNVLVVPPDLEFTALTIVKSAFDPAGATMKANLMQGRLEVIVSPYITDTDSWFLLDTRKAVKPLIMQNRISTELTALEANSQDGFMRDIWAYGVRARYNAGYGIPQCALGSTGAG